MGSANALGVGDVARLSERVRHAAKQLLRKRDCNLGGYLWRWPSASRLRTRQRDDSAHCLIRRRREFGVRFDSRISLLA